MDRRLKCIHCTFSIAVQTEDNLHSSFAKFQNEAITIAIVAAFYTVLLYCQWCACRTFYRVMRETVTVGHFTGWCEKLWLWGILQGDARNCACGPFYTVMRETVTVVHSTGWCEKLCMWDILQYDARNCACGPFHRVMRETVPVGHSTEWCEKLYIWVILQGNVWNCALGPTTGWCKELCLWLYYRVIKGTLFCLSSHFHDIWSSHIGEHSVYDTLA